MKVVKNVPQTPPPATYDILGLTEEEASVLLRLLFGHVSIKSGLDRIRAALADGGVQMSYRKFAFCTPTVLHLES